MTRSRGPAEPPGAEESREAEESRKPDWPTDLGRRPWTFVAKRVLRRFVQDGCPDLAASLTFYALLALFPASMAVVSLVSILGQEDETIQRLLDMVEDVASPETAQMLRGPIEDLAASALGGLVLAVGLLLTIWSASRYVAALGRGMNRIYGVAEGRMLWKLTPIHLLVTLVALLLVSVSVVLLVVSGPIAEALGEILGLGETVLLVWRILRWPLVVLLVIVVVAFLYYFAPNVKQPTFRWMSLGAAVALIVLAIASTGFGLYVANFADYDRIYGSFAAVIVFFLWLWIANMALLVGVEFDAEVERVRELQAGIPAERQVQLPLRDATRIAKDVRRESEDAAEGRRIRYDEAVKRGEESPPASPPRRPEGR